MRSFCVENCLSFQIGTKFKEFSNRQSFVKHFSIQQIAENRHIPDDFLLRVAERLVPLVEQCVPGSAPGFRSLLGAGRQSMLRTSSGN